MMDMLSPCRRGLSGGSRTMLIVVNASGYCEIKIRFGQYRFGYPWALAEFTAHATLLSVIFGTRSPAAAQGTEFPMGSG